MSEQGLINIDKINTILLQLEEEFASQNDERNALKIIRCVYENLIERCPTIDPETLPIVQELREKLAQYKQGAHPGDAVWVVEHDEDGVTCELSQYIYVATVVDKVIVSPSINGSDDISEIMDYHAEQTVEEYSCDLAVYPACDCFMRRDDALAVLEEGYVNEPV